MIQNSERWKGEASLCKEGQIGEGGNRTEICPIQTSDDSKISEVVHLEKKSEPVCSEHQDQRTDQVLVHFDSPGPLADAGPIGSLSDEIVLIVDQHASENWVNPALAKQTSWIYLKQMHLWPGQYSTSGLWGSRVYLHRIYLEVWLSWPNSFFDDRFWVSWDQWTRKKCQDEWACHGTRLPNVGISSYDCFSQKVCRLSRQVAHESTPTTVPLCIPNQ